MSTPSATGAPSPDQVCPLCGGPNACGPARCGDFGVPCWCRKVKFSEALPARIAEAKQSLACICPACAAAAADDAPR